MSRTETKGLSERERQRQNRIPVIAHHLAHKFFPWALNRFFTDALFKVDAYF